MDKKRLRLQAGEFAVNPAPLTTSVLEQQTWPGICPEQNFGTLFMKSALEGRKSAWVLGAPFLGFVLLFVAWLLLPVSEWLQSFSTWAQSLGLTRVVLPSAVYVVGTLLLIPGIPMMLAVAVAYGWWALQICGIGGLLAALIAFLIGRFIARDLVKRLTERHPILKAIDSVAHEETFKAIPLARLNPVTPFAMENYAFWYHRGPARLLSAGDPRWNCAWDKPEFWVGVIGRTGRSKHSELGFSHH